MVIGIKEKEIKNTIYTPDVATITKIEQVTPSEILFDIAIDNPSKQKEFNFKPGQFVELTVFGLGEAPFSITSSPNNKDFFQPCIRDMGNVSRALRGMKEGAKVGIRGPFGKGYFPYEKMKDKNVIIKTGERYGHFHRIASSL